MLFADLVGFTTLSESRDAEEVRELLSAYSHTARRLIGRYGGTVEKFIGDAVMAVWALRLPERTTRSGPSEPRSSSSTPFEHWERTRQCPTYGRAPVLRLARPR